MISKKRIKILSIVIGICSVFAIGCGSKDSSNKIYLNDYVVIEETGVEGYGIVKASIDYEKIMEDYAEKFENIVVWEYEDQEQSDHSSCTCEQCTTIGDCLNCDNCWGKNCGCLIGYSYVFKPYDADPSYSGSGENLCTIHDYTLEDATRRMLEYQLPGFIQADGIVGLFSENAKNGDKIQFKWDERGASVEDLEKILDVKVEYKDFSYEVHKLKEVAKIDPFKDVVLMVMGKNGTGVTPEHAYTYITLSKDIIQEFRLAVEVPENNGSLKNGDVLHVKFYENLDEEILLKEYGVVFSRKEADIKVHGLNAYGQAGASDGEKATINLNEYVRFRDIGYDSYGWVQAIIDYDKMLRDYKMSLSENVSPEDLLGYENSQYTANYICERKTLFQVTCTSHSCGENRTFTDIGSNLRNGEKLELSWIANEEGIAALQKVMNVEFTYSDFTHIVDGLDEAREFDPFEKYEVSYEGQDGNGYASANIYIRPYEKNPTEEEEWEVEIIADNNGALKNGDVITLSVKKDTEDDKFLDNWGLVPTRTEIEITVEGLEK